MVALGIALGLNPADASLTVRTAFGASFLHWKRFHRTPVLGPAVGVLDDAVEVLGDAVKVLLAEAEPLVVETTKIALAVIVTHRLLRVAVMRQKGLVRV